MQALRKASKAVPLTLIMMSSHKNKTQTKPNAVFNTSVLESAYSAGPGLVMSPPHRRYPWAGLDWLEPLGNLLTHSSAGTNPKSKTCWLEPLLRHAYQNRMFPS